MKRRNLLKTEPPARLQDDGPHANLARTRVNGPNTGGRRSGLVATSTQLLRVPARYARPTSQSIVFPDILRARARNAVGTAIGERRSAARVAQRGSHVRKSLKLVEGAPAK